MFVKEWLGRIQVPTDITMTDFRQQVFEKEISRSDFVDEFKTVEDVRIRCPINEDLGEVL
jgi:hypothetical protein